MKKRNKGTIPNLHRTKLAALRNWKILGHTTRLEPSQCKTTQGNFKLSSGISPRVNQGLLAYIQAL